MADFDEKRFDGGSNDKANKHVTPTQKRKSDAAFDSDDTASRVKKFGKEERTHSRGDGEHDSDVSRTESPVKKSPGISMNIGGPKISMNIGAPKISMNIGGPKKVVPVKMSMPSQDKKESKAVLPKSQKVASVFNEDSDSEEEEMPPEAKMRMRNVGRETPTAAGPNSFGKGNLGFCDRTKMIERDLKKQMQEYGERADTG